MYHCRQWTTIQIRGFRQYLKSHDIRLRIVMPYWPSANGEVERFNRTLGKAIRCAHAEGKQ